MTRKESIDQARHCIEVMKKVGTFRGQQIGISQSDGGITLRRGDIVLFKDDTYDGKTFVVEHACSKEWIEENLKKNNHCLTHSTCVCVPKHVIIPLKTKYQHIFEN